jgi:hypothetical protein
VKKSKPSFLQGVFWNTQPRRSSKVELLDIDPFDARGMKRVYGRGDDYSQRGHVFNMSIWLAKDDRLFSRFWARSKGIRDKSLEVMGFNHKGLPLTYDAEKPFEIEVWASECLRDAYSYWIDDQVCYILPSYYARVQESRN